MKLNNTIKKVVCGAFALMLTGCGIMNSADTLMSPPMLTEEQSLVYDALTKAVGKADLVYPKKGKSRSAYMICDLDSDGADEAVVFYRDSNSESVVRVNFLENENGSWRSVYDHAASGTDLQSVSTAVMSENGSLCLVTGYSLISADEYVLEIYSFDDNKIKTEYSGSYHEYFVTDIDGGGDDIIILGPSSNRRETDVTLLEHNESGVYERSSVRLADSNASVVNVTIGKADENTPALFIDELDDSSLLSTEIVCFRNGELENPSLSDSGSIRSSTLRKRDYLSADIDNDGITEIPVTEELVGYNDDPDAMYLTKWNVLSNNRLNEKYSGYYNRNQKWSLMFPQRWKELVTVRSDTQSGTVVFCRYSQSVESSAELLRITTVAESMKEEYISGGWQEIVTSENGISYMVRTADNKENLVLTMTEIKDNFYVSE